MGFYGNITNSTRTQFSFDAVYGSRYEMDAAAGTDHVYVGRYVLVEYDSSIGSLDNIMTAYKVVDERHLKDKFAFCISQSIQGANGQFNESSIIQCGNETSGNTVTKGTIIQIPGDHNQMVDNSENAATEYWICTGQTTKTYYVEQAVKDEESGQTIIKMVEQNYQSAQWESVGTTKDTNFTLHYNQDKLFYGVSRGYDSTVWQKVLQNGYEKYVMIAELNTIVPTFDISADAPTLTPLMPHFDTNSTNVYYKLHWQPAWGFRIKSANNYQTPQITPEGETGSSTINVSAGQTFYPSDEFTTWKKDFYDTTSGLQKSLYASPSTNGEQLIWNEKSKTSDLTPQLDAAIYFNREGMLPERVTKSWDNIYLGHNGGAPRRDPLYDPYFSDEDLDVLGFVSDDILVEPSGYSGQQYENHNGVQTAAPDTQELSIMLPSIGDAISDVWDLVYGGRATNEKIKKTNDRNQVIEWNDARAEQFRDGLRLVQDGYTYYSENDGKIMTYDSNYYNKSEVNTIAGCINSVHDLMGMIIQPYETKKDLNKNLDENAEDVIYYEKNDQKYYRKGETYTYETIADDNYTFEVIELSEGEYRPDLYYIKDDNGKYITATGVYNENHTYYIRTLNVGETFNKVTLSPFDGSKYYYKNLLSNGKYDYISEQTYYPNKTYYTMKHDDIAKTRVDLGDGFLANEYYEFSSNDNTYYRSEDAEYKEGKKYYAIEELFALKDVDHQPTYTNLYLPGIFYYRAWNKNVYEEIQYEGSISIDQLYILNEDGTYTKATHLNDKDTCYVLLHKEQDPYLIDEGDEEFNKQDFQYIIDNTDMGIGATNPATASGKKTIVHYMIKAGAEKPVEFYTEVLWYAPIKLGDDIGKPYEKGKYFIYDESLGSYIKCEDDSFDQDIQYYEEQKKYVYTYEGGTIDEQNPLILLPYSQTEIDYVDPQTGTRVENYNISTDSPWFLKERYTKKDGSIDYCYTSVTATSIRKQLIDYYINGGISNGRNLSFYQLKRTLVQEVYIADNYYYQVGKNKNKDLQGSYILETTPKRVVDNKTDYSLAHLKIDDSKHCQSISKDIKFYYPNHFYRIDDNGKYILAQEKEYNNSYTYYEDAQYYIESDSANILNHGERWNLNIKHVPPTITLAKRTQTYTYHELVDFARKLNTIHGMILKLNQILDLENTDTRDINTIRGALNTFKDWIAHLDELNSQELMIVDNYGRIHSAPISVEQTDEKGGIDHSDGDKTDITGIKSDVFPRADDFTEAGGWKNQWLTVNVDGKPTNPQITLRHNYQPVKDTDSSCNLNKNKTKSDDIVLYTPIVDPRGHVVGQNNHTVTLPYGFKTIATNGRSDSTSLNASTSPTTDNVDADNTQDTLSINSGNKWIRIDTDADNDVLTISHDVHNFTTSAKSKTDLNNPALDEITLQDVTFDKAGHMTGNQSHTYVLPYGFKFISTNGRVSNNNTTILGDQATIEADNTQDTLNINSGNEWIKIITDTDKDILTISHDVKTTTSTTSTKSLSSESGSVTFEVPTYSFDSTNHFSGKDVKTITMPNSYGKISADGNTSTEASATHDTFTLSGDSWIKTTASKDKVSFVHQDALTTDNTQTYSTNAIPALGAKFKVPVVSYDKKGHISSNTTYEVTLPSLELIKVKDDTDNVITNFDYTKNGTELKATFGKIGDLALTGYTLPTQAAGDINAVDSLNTAIGKLQFNLNNEISNRKEAITKISPIVDFKEDDSIPSLSVTIGDNITSTNIPLATTSNFGFVKLTDDYDLDQQFESDEDPFKNMAVTANALQKLAEKVVSKDNYFTYHKTTIQEDGTIDSSEEISLTTEELIARMEILERAAAVALANINPGYVDIDMIEALKKAY